MHYTALLTVNWLAKCRYHFVHVKKEIDTDKHVAICMHRLFYISLQSISYNNCIQHYNTKSRRGCRSSPEDMGILPH